MKNKNLRLYLISIALFALVLGGASYYYYGLKVKEAQANPVVAEVGDEKIYLSDYKERLYSLMNEGTPEQPSYIDDHIKEPVLNELIELAVLEKFFESKNVQVSNSDVVKAAQEYAGASYATGTSAEKKSYEGYVKLKLDRELFEQDYLSWKKDFALFCPYDRSYQSDYDQGSAKAKELLAKQKPYAEKYCKQLKTRLEAGSSVENELTALSNDPNIGKEIWRPNNIDFSFRFNKDNYADIYFPNTYDFFEKLSALNQGKGKYSLLNVNDDSDKQNIRDAFYAVVYIDDEKNGIASDYQSWFKSQKETLGVKTYIERVKI